MIQVKKRNDNKFQVVVDEQNSATEHIVTIDDEYYQELTRGKISKEELIKKSFAFLLEREPKESILSKFNLSVIRDYFPEYEQRIKG